jgi:hypothetical protein
MNRIITMDLKLALKFVRNPDFAINDSSGLSLEKNEDFNL